MPETSEEESEGDVSPIELIQALATFNIRVAEKGALVGWTDGLALSALDDMVKTDDVDPLDPWEKVQLIDDDLAAIV